MSPVSGPVRLGQLLSMAYAFCKAHIKTIIVASIIFGTIASFLTGTLQLSAAGKMGMMMENMGMDMQKIEELTERMQAGDESASQELQAIMQDRFGSMSDDEAANLGRSIGMNVFKGLLPQIGVGLVIGLILLVVANIYYLLLALGEKDPIKIAKRIPGLFLPVLGVWIWAFLRSFAWIPIVGWVVAIIIGPRFALSSVILVQERKGVMESVRSSYARTNGYWGKIVGNMIVMALCVMLASLVFGIVTSIIGSLSVWTAQWLGSVAQYVFMAFGIVFMVQLALTIMANPIAGAAAPAPLKPSAAPKKVVAAKPVVTKKKKTTSKKKAK